MMTPFPSGSLRRRVAAAAVAGFGLLFACTSHVQAQPASPLTAVYDPATGNLKLQNTSSLPLQISTFNVLTIGNGSVGPASPNNLGYLNGATVNSSVANPGSGISFAGGFSFRTSNIQTSGSNGQYSQIAAVLFPDELDPQPLFTLNPYSGFSSSSPIGPVGSYWELGNVASTAMSQTNLNSRFVTDSLEFGKFSYGTLNGTGIAAASGNVITAVPEPATLVLAGAGLAGLGVWRVRKRQG
jgi:hypothetical protein